jgi:hypothetical protein
MTNRMTNPRMNMTAAEMSVACVVSIIIFAYTR